MTPAESSRSRTPPSGYATTTTPGIRNLRRPAAERAGIVGSARPQAASAAAARGGIRAHYANVPVAAPEFHTDEIAVRAECFAQRGDLNFEALFAYHNTRPHPVEKLLLCDERAVSLQQDQKEVEGAR